MVNLISTGVSVSKVVTDEIIYKIEKYDFIVIPREKNVDFFRKYRLNKTKVREMKWQDYVDEVEDYDGFKHGLDFLVIFEKEVKLTNFHGVDEYITIYVKVKNVEGRKVPVVSFRKSEG